MRSFLTIWIGQTISLFGSGLTSFVVLVWVFQTTGSISSYAMVVACRMVPAIVISPLVGTLVDRWNRRWTMLIADTGDALCSLAVVAVLSVTSLEVWHAYVYAAISALFSAFHGPAFAASTTLLVPKRHLGRAAGLMSASGALERSLAPLVAGLLLLTIGMRGVIAIDVSTCVIAVTILLVVRIPDHTRSTPAGNGTVASAIWPDLVHAWRIIGTRPGLFALFLLENVFGFIIGLVFLLATPLVLSFATPDVLGAIMSVSGVGLAAGAIAMSVWGGPKQRVYGILGSLFIASCAAIVTGLRPSAWLIAAAGAGMFFVIPIMGGCSRAIWQTKVAVGSQGRVFAFHRTIRSSVTLVVVVIAGPLADHVFIPLLVEGGPLADSIGRIVGVGPGRGIGLLFIVLGLLCFPILITALGNPRLRLLEDELEDVVSPSDETPDQQSPEAESPRARPS